MQKRHTLFAKKNTCELQDTQTRLSRFGSELGEREEMRQALPVIGAFVGVFVIGGLALFVMSSPTLSKLDWGLLISVGIVLFLIIAAIVAFGGRKVLFAVIGIVVLVTVVTVIAAVNSSISVHQAKQMADVQAKATATAIEQQREANTPPGYIYQPVIKPPDLMWPAAWGVILVAVGLVSVSMWGLPKTPTLLVVTCIHAALYHELDTWMATIATLFILVGVGKILMSIFGIAVAMVTHFTTTIFGMVFAAILAAVIYMFGGAQVWTTFLMSPKSPEQWVVIGMAVVPTLIFLGLWPTPPD